MAGTALITGASRRIGAAIARDLAAQGWTLMVHSRAMNADLETLLSEITQQGGRATPIFADLMNEDAVAGLMDRASAEGPISLLVNNASVFEEDTLDTATWDGFDKHMAVHVKAPMTLAKHFCQQGLALQDRLIVNIIDQRVWRLNPSFTTYTLSKSALWTLTQTMAQALAPSVRVNAIGPGPTLQNDFQDTADFAAEAKAVPLEKATDPNDIAATIRFLWQSKSVTGQMVALDGGQHLAWKTPDVVFSGPQR